MVMIGERSMRMASGGCLINVRTLSLRWKLALQLTHSLTVILVDRNAAHLDKSSLDVQWNKMAWTAITSPSLPAFPEPFSPATQMCQSLGHVSSRRQRGKSLNERRVKILYANRQMTDRRLSQSAHAGLLDAFGSMVTKGVVGIGKQVKIHVEVVDARFEEMTLKEQFGVACEADVGLSMLS